MENVHDWCISRQLWWGQQIPAYYLPDGTFVVALTAEAALVQARAQSGNANLQLSDLRQDEDVLDTWFSSWLWPISVFDGFKDPDNADVNYFYPTNDLVTGPDILFFWVARMIMAGLEYRKEVPFKNVYLTGIVRDAQGRKMSKQLGNSPDPLELIAQYGADGVRTGMLFSAPAGNDLLFDIKLVEQGRNFSNKLWNAFRLVKGWEMDAALPFANEKAVTWFNAKLQAAIVELDDHFEKFRMSDALMTVYKLVWDDFCAQYLEMVKPAYQHPIDAETLRHTTAYLETLLKLLHPFMPFITEELWHELAERAERDYVCVAPWPRATAQDNSAELLANMDKALAIVAGIRTVRNQKNLGPNKPLALVAKTDESALLSEYEGIIRKLGSISELTFANAGPAASVSFVQGSSEFFIPLEGHIDLAAERTRLEKELEYAQGFRESVQKKLGNERFAANAKPDVLERERQKLADAEAKIAALEQALKSL
jgi:valyl-tRNA synthetase